MIKKVCITLILLVLLIACTFQDGKQFISTIDINIREGFSSVLDGSRYFVGTVEPGKTRDYTFVIENIGVGGNLLLTADPAITLTGSGFTLQNQPAATALAPGEQTSFIVRFSPIAYEFYQAIITIANNDKGEEDFTFSIVGSGAAFFEAPIVSGPASPTTNRLPTWTWVSGGGGNGTFRYKLDSNDLSSGAIITTELSYTQGTPFSDSGHTLYVQERDKDDTMWSESGYLYLYIRGAKKPVVTGPYSPCANRMPTWTWVSGGDGIGSYRYKLDNNDLTSGATVTTDTSFTPLTVLLDGFHWLYVQECDGYGFWSTSGSFYINIKGANAPIVTGTSTPTQNTLPEWNWVSGGGGNGTFRYKLDSSDLTTGAIETTELSYTSIDPLPDGNHALYVQESDSYGVFSSSGMYAVFIEHVIALGCIGGGYDGWTTYYYNWDCGPAYKNFYYPRGLFIDVSGNIYVADSANHKIYKWNSDGISIGWIGGGSDGWKTSSGTTSGSDYQSFNYPYGVYVDFSGYIYVADTLNHRICKWNASGTAMGWIGGGSDGWNITSGSTAGTSYQDLNRPYKVYVDTSGNIFVADYYNDRISKWNASGTAIGWMSRVINIHHPEGCQGNRDSSLFEGLG